MQKLAIAIGLVCCCSSALSAQLGYVLNTNQTIELTNVSTNNSVPFSTTFFPSDSLAITPAGSLISADPNGVLWDVTAAPIPIGPTGKTQVADLDFAPNGLWGFSNSTNELFFFDLGLNTTTYSQAISLPGTGIVTGVAFETSSGDTYLCSHTSVNNDFLLRIPAFTSTAQLVGAMNNGDAFSYFSDIDFDASGTLYAMSWFHRYFYTVSTANGNTTFVSAGPHRDTTGLALSPVPEPASLAVIVMGIGVLARKRQTK